MLKFTIFVLILTYVATEPSQDSVATQDQGEEAGAGPSDPTEIPPAATSPNLDSPPSTPEESNLMSPPTLDTQEPDAAQDSAELLPPSASTSAGTQARGGFRKRRSVAEPPTTPPADQDVQPVVRKSTRAKRK